MATKPSPRRSPLHWQKVEPKPPLARGKVVTLVLLTAVVTVLATSSIDKLHYNNELTQAQQAYTTLQNTESAEHADVGFVIQHYPTALNCYQLSSSYGQALCRQHNAEAANQ